LEIYRYQHQNYVKLLYFAANELLFFALGKVEAGFAGKPEALKKSVGFTG
jgi:hypothetical protein